jgi:hypothetical protein
MNMKTYGYLLCIFLSVALMACSSPQSGQMPSPTTSEYFKTVGGGFITSKGGGVTYALVFKVQKPLNGSNPWFAEVSFENPENRDKPISGSSPEWV